jgi:hypothetical protein
MTDDLIREIIAAILTFAVTFGAVQTKVTRLEKQVDQLDATLDRTRETYVTNAAFESVIRELKEENRELRGDIKEILSILTKERSKT